MNKKIFIFLVVALFVIFLFVIYKIIFEKNKLCFAENKCVDVEIADELSERQMGLMSVEKLDENEGMFFIFENSDKHSFWMKNTLIPLDIIWIGEELEVVDIQSSTPCIEEPCAVYSPAKEARYVLEVNYGFTEKEKIKIGDRIIWLN